MDIVFENKVPRPLHENGKPSKTSHETQANLRNAEYNKVMLERIGYPPSRLPNESPVEAYALALDILRDTRKPLSREFIKDVEDVARSAARSSLLDRQLGTWTHGMQIKKDDYERFIDYHDQCRVRLVASLKTEELIKNTGSHWIWYNTRCGVCPLTPKSYAVPTKNLGTMIRPTTWWVTYLEGTIPCVQDSPCEETFENEHIWQSILQALGKECPTCHRTAAREFPLFKKRLLKIVTEIVDSVELEIKL